MMELNYTMIVPTKIQPKILSINFDKESRLHFKWGHRMFESLNQIILVVKDGFEATFSMISQGMKILIYLKI